MRRVALAVLVSLFAFACVLVGRAPQGYATQHRDFILVSPGTPYLAGTDELGRDQALRMSLALVLSLTGACCASAVSTSASVLTGIVSAAAPRWLRAVLLYLGDLSLTLPWLFLLMLVRSSLPLNLSAISSASLTFGLLAILGAPVFLRVNYEKVRRLLQSTWILQGQAAGLTKPQILMQMLPHIKSLFWSQFLLFIPTCILAEANLGTLGLGLSEPLPSLGTFLANLQQEMLLHPSALTLLPVTLMVISLVALELTVFGVES